MSMTLIRNFIPGIVLLAAATAATAPVAAAVQEVKSPVLATFSNGEVITEQDLARYLDRRIDLKAAARNTSGVTLVVQEMALARALALEGPGLGVARRGEGGDDRFDDIYAHAVLKKISPACEAPKDEAAAHEFYDKNPKAFAVPTSIRLSRIILPVGSTVEGEPEGGWLMEQVQAIGAGHEKFEDAALKAEKVYKADVQGDLGWVALNEENQILRALGSANQGDIVGPVKDGDFVYLFQIVAKRPGQIMPWSSVSASAAQRAVNYCREQGRSDVQQRLYKKYGVHLDENAVSAMFKRK